MQSGLSSYLPPDGSTVTRLVSAGGSGFAPVEQAKELDKHYIPTRYPNGFERGAPTDFYTRNEAEMAIHNAEAIVEFCRHKISR